MHIWWDLHADINVICLWGDTTQESTNLDYHIIDKTIIVSNELDPFVWSQLLYSFIHQKIV